MDSDFFLVLKMKNGDEEAIEKIVQKYYPSILRYCKYHISNNNDAEDITQETFEKFFYAIGNYKHQGKIINYLYTIAGNLCKDFYKQKDKESSIETDYRENDIESEIEQKLDINLAINKLPDELKEVILLHYFQGLKLKEISQILNIGLPLVKYRIKEAKRKLEIFLERGK